MVELITPQVGVQARQAGQVSTAPARALAQAAGVAKGVAGQFTEFYEKEAAIQNDLLLATTQADWTRRYDETKGSAGAGYAEGMLNDYDDYVRGIMEAAPQRGRAELELAHDKYRLNLETKALQREAAARAAAKAAAQAEADRLRINALISDPSLLDETMDGATQKQQEKYVSAALSGTMMFDPTSVNEDVMGGKWDAYLTPSQKLSFGKLSQTAMDRIAREEEAQRKAEQQQYLAGLDEETAYIERNGGWPSDSQFSNEEIDTMFEGDPEKATELKRIRDEAATQAEAINAVSSAMPVEIEGRLTELSEAIKEPGHTEEDVGRLNAYLNAVAGRNGMIREDAATYIHGNWGMAATGFNIYENADPDTKAVAFDNYVYSLESAYDIMGIPVELQNILPKPKAQAMVASLNSIGADAAPQTLADLRDTWGENAPRVIAELEKEGLAYEYVASMRIADNVAVAARVASLAGVAENDLKENIPTITVTDAKREMIEAHADYQAAFLIGDSSGQAAKTYNQNAEIARKLTWQDIAGGMEPSDAIERNYGAMFPGEPINESNTQLVIPPDVDAGSLRRTLDTAREEEALRTAGIVALDDPRLAEFQDIEIAIEALTRDGVWVGNSTGDGAVLMYNINGYLLPVTLQDGSFYQKMFGDIPERGQTQLEAFADIWPLK